MLDILTIVHNFADTQTASRIRRTCRRLAFLTSHIVLYSKPRSRIEYEYRVGSKLHRLDGPAKEDIYGYKDWYRGGLEHREYHPQGICTYKHCIDYMVEGEWHREVGPSIVYAAIEAWFMRGMYHRKTGPAYTWHGMTHWYTLGKGHRLDGPVYENRYEIRGTEHYISSTTRGMWIVDGRSIRE